MTATMQDSKFGDRLFLTPRVPQGLAAAVEGLTREVIRHQPENIYVFAARHFENLLRLREQYDEAVVAKNGVKILNDYDRAIREEQRNEAGKEYAQANAWSLNETAKVLEKHRSIFGESGQKISTDQIRELANESTFAPAKAPDAQQRKRSNDAGAGADEHRDARERYAPRRANGNVERNDARNAPRIISQIPIAKDIKTELKKNRSRERRKNEDKRMHVACEYAQETVIEKSSRKTVEKTSNSHEYKSEQRRSSRTEESTRKKVETTRNKVDSREERNFSRSTSMDCVKNYVMQNFVGMTSLEELQTPSYVEKVQEVIDETSTVIKEKVEALKNGVVKTTTKSQKSQRKQRSWGSDQSDRLNDAEEKGDLVLEALSPLNLSTAEADDSNSKASDNKDDPVDQAERSASDRSDGSERSGTSLPAMRPPSSRSTSRSLSARSNSDGLVLPPISPESAKSPKVKEDLVLPALSGAATAAAVAAAVAVAVVAQVSDSTLDVPPADSKDRLEVKRGEEEFHDSLNASPRTRDSPPRPDSLESPAAEPKSGSATPLETLKDKLLEIEQVQKRIEGVLDEGVNGEPDGTNDDTNSRQIHEKLIEIEESERRIERILDSQGAQTAPESVASNHDIKSKLEEVQEAERRIESIFVGEAERDESDVKGTLEIDAERPPERPSEEGEDPKSATDDKDNDSDLKADDDGDDGRMRVPTDSNRAISPHSYILTEGSPYEIPDSVTTVIIPERSPTPDSDAHQIDPEEARARRIDLSTSSDRTETKEAGDRSTSILDAFGEPVQSSVAETSTVDLEYIRGIRLNHDLLVSRQDLDRIQEEERDQEETQVVDSEDERVLRVVTSSLEEILENNAVEYISKEEAQLIATSNEQQQQKSETETSDASDAQKISDRATEADDRRDAVGETTTRSSDTTNDFRETTRDDASISSLEPGAFPLVPELNLDSLPDLTISSYNLTADDESENKEESRAASLEMAVDSEGLGGNVAPHDETILEPADPAREDVDAGRTIEGAVDESQKEKALEVESSSNAPEQKSEAPGSREPEKKTAPDAADATLEVAISGENNNAESRSSARASLVPEGADDAVCDKSEQTVRENENNTLDEKDARAGMESRETENEEATVEKSVINANEKSAEAPPPDSSHCTSTRQSGDLSIETNADDAALEIDRNQGADAPPEHQRLTTTEKSIERRDLVTGARTENLEVNDVNDDGGPAAVNDRTPCHVYVPDASSSKELSSSSESSTFVSAATRIQAGFRGFLTRRRLQSGQNRSSTLDSVPSIPESIAVESSTLEPGKAAQLVPIVESEPAVSDARARKKLRREDAVQRTTLSVENAFAENQLQHTGEFHDCIPLPVFDARALDLKVWRDEEKRRRLEKASRVPGEVEQILGKILLGHSAPSTALPGMPELSPFVDVVLLPGDTDLQSKYLNFITSVEDVFSEALLPGTPKGVIIEEITSLDESKSSASAKAAGDGAGASVTPVREQPPSPACESDSRLRTDEPEEASSLVEASLSTEEPLSLNIEQVLGLGEEAIGTARPSSGSCVSRDSRLGDELPRSPVTMMQAVASASADDGGDELSIAGEQDDQKEDRPTGVPNQPADVNASS